MPALLIRCWYRSVDLLLTRLSSAASYLTLYTVYGCFTTIDRKCSFNNKLHDPIHDFVLFTGISFHRLSKSFKITVIDVTPYHYYTVCFLALLFRFFMLSGESHSYNYLCKAIQVFQHSFDIFFFIPLLIKIRETLHLNYISTNQISSKMSTLKKKYNLFLLFFFNVEKKRATSMKSKIAA